MAIQLKIDMPANIKVGLGRNSGRSVSVDVKRLGTNVVSAILTAGVKVILTNVYNGGGKDMKPDAREAAVQKKLDAWYRGEFNILTRGDSMVSAMRDAYIDDIRAKTGCSQKDVEDEIRATVKATYGEKESATFGRFLDALALSLSKENGTEPDTEREAVESYLEGLVETAAKARQAVKVDLKGLALSSFQKKPA